MQPAFPTCALIVRFPSCRAGPGEFCQGFYPHDNGETMRSPCLIMPCPMPTIHHQCLVNSLCCGLSLPPPCLSLSTHSLKP
ncbi:hypothetical protein B0T25DRAFT_535270, partial [Lasiosphaeria hispida]